MRNYYKLFIAALLLMGGYSFTTDYFSDEKKQHLEEDIAAYEKLVASPTEAVALLDSVYTERTIKIMGAPIKTYETTYFFEANGQKYTGLYNPTEPPTIPVIPIQYLAEDPSINSADAKKQLASLHEESTSNLSLYLGLGLFLFGGISAYSNISAIRKRRRDKEMALQQELEEFNRSRGVVQ
ncbi:hypothetical protein H8S95_12120 [Pontibacter sp. KCTC 32443]|uniref:hypothetical protein n=1 Tax=Pontibacter TaxID=323449 RepID=UPI00164E5E25|nr:MULTISPECIES: hypothetical protein [Pontibacter]MBC5774813.1 hypothetical protein [Pontibacter sp. KCTC 32443]